MVKNLPANAGDADLIDELGESHGQRSLVNPMDRGAWWATAHGVAESQTRLNDEAQQRTHLCLSVSI